MLRSPAFNRVQAELIFTELDLVETFLKISRTSRETETQQRNRTHARKAYAMARRYASRLTAPIEVNRAIEKRFREVERALNAAGEAVDHTGGASIQTANSTLLLGIR